MPELPEVETIVRGIKPHLLHQVIENVDIRHFQLRWPIPADIQLLAKGKKVQQIERRAKYLLFTLDAGFLLLHLGMSGSLRILTEKIKPQKHDHFDIAFTNQIILRFKDPRRFGAFLWIDQDPFQHHLLKNLGPEPLTQSFSGDYLYKKASNKTMAVKSFIMNSQIVSGVGNIYAAEALFLARIHPLTPAKILTLKQCQQLVKSIKIVLRNAIQQGGTTLKDFVNSEGNPGYFAHQLKVYGRDGEPCTHCHSKLSVINIAQRTTVFCKKCQH